MKLKLNLASIHRIITVAAVICILLAALFMIVALFGYQFVDPARLEWMLRFQYGTLFFMLAVAFGTSSALLSLYRTSIK